MSETPLTSDQANALSGTTDADTDFVFPAIGESPYYTTVFRCLDRLLTLGRTPGNALRVYQDAASTFAVRAGRFWDGFQARTYAGSSAQGLTNNQTNYVYLLADGTLTVSTSGFPQGPHVPLASIIVSDGAFTQADLTDCRSLALFRPAGGLAVSAGAEVDDARTVTVQGPPGRTRLRVWVATGDYGQPSADGNSVALTTGTLLRELQANADYELISDADGAVVLTLTVAGAASRYVLAEHDGRVFSSGLLTWS
ncbi:MAG: hypothetical protein BWX88_05168 [Planctomycetes bacterium ADurb.Bin126]|nr:MAG: hypothetical protein BWX88_05168 [Planctomycetes bacterium ADurb.Bin126]HOD83846.1 hypothetical protein [Phycisphaerae bacterium]HQL72709.1 hypothetical protein [Phycisphaerae bacterium]